MKLLALDGRRSAEESSVLLRLSDRWRPVEIAQLRAIPGSPLAYWAGSSAIDTFRTKPVLEQLGIVVTSTNPLNDDFRYARCGWEVKSSATGRSWVPWSKGGPHAYFYLDVEMVISWSMDRMSYQGFLGTANRPLERPASLQYFFKPGATWSRRSQRGLSVRLLPSGCVFGDKGPYIGAARENVQVDAYVAITNSAVFRYLANLQMSFGSFEVGVIQRTPVPAICEQADSQLSHMARSGWSARRGLDTSSEVSHAFVVPAVLQVPGDGFATRVSAWAGRVADVEAELVRVQSEIDELCFELYGISDEDRRAITEGFGLTNTDDDETVDDADEDESDAGVVLDPVGLAAGLVSWAVGVAAGRFDVRHATGERDWPAEPDPFDPLPVCSPGMLTGDDGLPVMSLPDGYPLVPSPVLVDDPGHELDITARVRAVFDVVFGDLADSWWSEVGGVLDAKNGVEGWLRRGFFDHHLKTYSKSRRKAPIMWPIGTKSGSYQVWLYAHSVTPDTVFRLLGDVIEPKLAAEQRQLSDLTQEFGPSPTASQRRALDAQQKLVDEITELRDEILAIAALWHPDLNDGIVIVLAPLWRLFTQHRAWSKELKDRWVKLAKGDYDWAQLALHIWPERVIPKCATDRSLAIAHNLEDIFWAQDDTNPDKWHPRNTPTTPIDHLIAERTNPTTTTTRNHPNP